MKVEVITQAVSPQALKAKVDALCKNGCDKANKSKQSVVDIELANILMRQDIDKLKEKLEVKE